MEGSERSVAVEAFNLPLSMNTALRFDRLPDDGAKKIRLPGQVRIGLPLRVEVYAADRSRRHFDFWLL